MTEATTTPPDNPVQEVAGVSLWQDGLSRLKKNRMAVAGTFVVAFMALLALVADILPLDPTTRHDSAQNLPPFSTAMDVEPQMLFKVGQRAPFPYIELQTDTLLFVTEPLDAEEIVYRVRLRRGRINSIKEEVGAVEIDSLSVRGEGMLVQVLTQSDTFDFQDITLRKGQGLPAAMAEQVKERAFTLKSISISLQLSEVRIALDSGLVTLIGVGPQGGLSKPREQLQIEDWTVHSVRHRGKDLSLYYWLGSDASGRDQLSRLIYGGRISLMVGLVATLVSLLIGVLYGSFAGYLGGWVDRLMMRVVDILYALPYMFLVIILLVSFGRNLLVLFIALGCVQWLTMARIVRGQVLSLKEKEFIEAAHTIGTPTWKIITRHLIPNTIGTIVVYTTLTVPAVILQEAFLSFLGLNVEFGGKPLESWGALVNQGWKVIKLNGWPFALSAFVLSITLFSLNFLGDGLRDALDPQQRGRR